MAKEQFLVPESRQVWNAIETAANRSHHSPSRAFDDFLTMTVCALSGGRMEAEYLEVAKRYSDGPKGRRAIDAFPEAFGNLVQAMEKTRKDILGDIFEGAIARGENGQFFTPETICQLMARMTMEAGATRVCDPCVGSGRNLLAAADVNPHAEFYGQDVDLRCVRMTTINLAFRNLYGWIIWGDSLKNEQKLILRTGFDGRGFVRSVEPEKVPEPVREVIREIPRKQLSLF